MGPVFGRKERETVKPNAMFLVRNGNDFGWIFGVRSRLSSFFFSLFA